MIEGTSCCFLHLEVEAIFDRLIDSEPTRQNVFQLDVHMSVNSNTCARMCACEREIERMCGCVCVTVHIRCVTCVHIKSFAWCEHMVCVSVGHNWLVDSWGCLYLNGATSVLILALTLFFMEQLNFMERLS